MAYPDATQGTSHFNSIAAAAADVGTLTGGKNWAGSTITGSSLALPTGGGMGGMAQVVSGSTGAAGATVSATHGLGVTPSFVALTNEGTSGGIQLMSRGTSLIHVQANIGTVGFRAMLWK